MNRDPKRSGDHVNAFLKAGDPVEPSALSGDGIESALDEIGAEIADRPRRANSRRMRRLSISKPRAALVIGFATIGIGAAVAGGSQLSAHTGYFQPKKYIPMGGPGESLYPGAPDFRDVALELSSDIPFPERYESWRDALIADEIRQASPNNYETSGALRGWLAMSAYCAWVLDWRYADIAGDTAAAAAAAQTVFAAPRWKAVTAEDPHLDPAATGEDGKSRTSLFGWMLPFRDAVLSGNRAQVEHLLVTEEHGGRCQDYDMDWRQLSGAHARDAGWLNKEELHYTQYLASRTS
jgi:hypothetical protein